MSSSEFKYTPHTGKDRRASFCSFGDDIFTKSSFIGKGGYGSVSTFTHVMNGSEIVVKQIQLRGELRVEKNETPDDLLKRLDASINKKKSEVEHEAELNKIVHGIGSVSIHEKKVDLTKLGGQKVDRPYTAYLCMKKLPPNLFQLCTSDLSFQRRHVSNIKSFLMLYLKVLQATKKLHEQFGIVHGDIKLENLCMDENDEIFFCDFGLARKLNGDESKPELTQGGGRPEYMAPELCQSIPADPNQDIYSLGSLLKRFRFFTIPEKIRQGIEDLAKNMENKNPSDRPSIDNVIAVVNDLIYQSRPWYIKARDRVQNNKGKALLITLGVALLVTAVVFAWPVIVAGGSAAAIFGAIGAGFSSYALSASTTTAISLGIGTVSMGAAVLILTKKIDKGIKFLIRKVHELIHPKTLEKPPPQGNNLSIDSIPRMTNPHDYFPPPRSNVKNTLEQKLEEKSASRKSPLPDLSIESDKETKRTPPFS